MSPDNDEWVPEKQVRREVGGKSPMTMYRWDRDPKMAALGWPPAVKIGNRKHRSRRGLNKFHDNLKQLAIEQRASLMSTAESAATSAEAAS